MEKTKVPISKRTILIASALVLAIGIPLAYLLITNTSEDSSAWYNTSWLYRRSIFISNKETQAINEEVLIEYDTKSLIDAGKLQNDCDDLRFVDSDDSTLLPYWIEGGCNSSQTQVWVRIPNLPESGKTIYMYYGNESAPNGQEEWTGDFLLLKDSACTNEWKMESDTGQDFYQRFPKGASMYGETGGSASHSHPQTILTSSSQISTSSSAKSGDSAKIADSHTHQITITSQDADALPPYLDMIICSNKNLVINQGLISLFDFSIPSGFTRFSSLDKKFPRGNSTYGGSSGVTVHFHEILATATDGPSSETTAQEGSEIYTASSTHTHTINQFITQTSENIPKYLSILYGQANNDSMAPIGVITMATALPPLGWTRFSQLDEYYPYGSSSYGTTGGSSSHTHSISATTGSDTAMVGLSIGTPSISLPIKSTHTHNIKGELQPYSNDPPYIKVLFIKKNSSKRATINNEEIPNQPPSSPTNLLTEGLVNPISVTSQSPKFSAIYSDPNLDNGIYFEIEVNTKADFTGTSMWDSGKRSISPIISGQRSPEILYMGNALSLNGITYYWRIRFWDSKDTQGQWSQTATFTTSQNKTTLIIPSKGDSTIQEENETLDGSNTIPNPPTSLYTEGSNNPIKVTDTTPEFSAIFSDPDASDTGVYYEIEVNTQSDFFGTVMWDSTKTAISPITNGSRSTDVSYAGTTLSLNGTTYYWRIRFWDNKGAVSNWSQTASFTMSGNPFSPTYLKTDGMENPTWILSTTPKFSALHTDPNSDSANYYEIEVNSNSSFTGTVMWDTGKVSMTSISSGSRSPEVTYAGTALTGSSGTTYYWRIRFWDTDGNVSNWSDTATFKDFIQTEEYIQMEKLKLEGIKIN
ncbi:MAG TPA: DUF2341 domain-containing protein [Candidatus Dojkabacteria bacterium]|nr:DUF2341 domain-containing protein [Candidatus Dojkabacteria bacterium]